MARYFTLRQAESVLPFVRDRLETAVHIKSELELAATELEEFSRRVAISGGIQIDHRAFLARRSRQDALSKRLRELLEEIQEHGCLVKDLDLGLLDFPTLYRGREVLLCWKLGEAGISYWHGTEEGFRGRKRIDQEFRDNHQGDSPA